MDKRYKIASIGAGAIVLLILAAIFGIYRIFLRPSEVCTSFLKCKPDPDGPRIAFSSNRSSQLSRAVPQSYYVYIMNVDGTCATKLTDTPNAFWPRWSPDGTRIAFEASGTLYMINPDGSQQKALANYGDCLSRPMWSPDSTKIAFLSGEDAENWPKRKTRTPDQAR
jgi:dipeptidyl aminopeptidase/acylaminoacyl peptidase